MTDITPDEGTKFFRGMMIATAMVLPLWAVIGFALWYFW
jgi:hypothetical protein